MIMSGIDKVHMSWNTTDLLVQWCYNSMKTLYQLQRTVCLHWLRMQSMCMKQELQNPPCIGRFLWEKLSAFNGILPQLVKGSKELNSIARSIHHIYKVDMDRLDFLSILRQRVLWVTATILPPCNGGHCRAMARCRGLRKACASSRYWRRRYHTSC
jgi:hypothetical protein